MEHLFRKPIAAFHHPLSKEVLADPQQPCLCPMLQGRGLLRFPVGTQGSTWYPSVPSSQPSSARSPRRITPRGFSPAENVSPEPRGGDVPWAGELGKSFAFKPWEGTFLVGAAAPGLCVMLLG